MKADSFIGVKVVSSERSVGCEVRAGEGQFGVGTLCGIIASRKTH